MPRYTLLLTDLIKHTEQTHPDSAALGQALTKMKQLAEDINKAISDGQNRQHILQIQASFLKQKTVLFVYYISYFL
jgi:hypothetical protein